MFIVNNWRQEIFYLRLAHTHNHKTLARPATTLELDTQNSKVCPMLFTHLGVSVRWVPPWTSPSVLRRRVACPALVHRGPSCQAPLAPSCLGHHWGLVPSSHQDLQAPSFRGCPCLRQDPSCWVPRHRPVRRHKDTCTKYKSKNVLTNIIVFLRC